MAAMAAAVLGACGSPATPSSSSPTTSTTATAALRTSTTTTTPPTSTTTTTPGPPWTPVSQDLAGLAVDERTFTAPSGRTLTLVRFHAGTVSFDLHLGSTDPPANLSALPADRGPAIAADEAPFLLAAFNGGFKMNAGEGGVEEQGQIVAPLVSGMASFVIDTNGTAHVGVWGQDLPQPGEAVSSVRQNQPPLIHNGVAAATVNNPGAWGVTVNSSMVVARSAVGQDAQGDIVYAGGMALYPADLAAALLSAGAVNAMQLDINPEWVQLDAAAGPGGPLATQIPGQNRPAGQYHVGWTRDFFAVLAPYSVPPKRPR
jgi:Phosphodiester glycosidase